MDDLDELRVNDVAESWRLRIAADMHAAAAELMPLDPALAAEYRARAERWMEPDQDPPEPPGQVRRFRRVK